MSSKGISEVETRSSLFANNNARDEVGVGVHTRENVTQGLPRLAPQTSLVLTAMQDKFPEYFDHLNAQHFEAEASTNMQLKLSEPSKGFKATMSYPDCTILLEGQDHPLCSLAGDFKLKHLGQLNIGINNDTVFTCSRIVRDTQDITKISALEQDGTVTSITIYDAFDGCPIVPQLRIRGKSKKVNLAQAKMLATLISHQAALHLTKTLGSGAIGWFNVETLRNGAAGKFPSNFSKTRIKLEKAGLLGGYRKWGGMVYEPIPGCPCAYTVRGTYKEFINSVLKGDEAFQSNPRRVKELTMYLTDFDLDEIQYFKPDLDILSFSNGVLQLGSVVFTPYEGMDSTDADGGSDGLASRVARHHISADTPLLDLILDFQFDSDVKELLYALIGRCFFKIGLKDGWQVMLFLVGVGGTGKSLVLNVVDALFAEGKVGNLAAKREEVFGMANLVTKELVLGRDMPAKMSASLPQEIMQSMTSGEGMEIPRKGLEALQVRWTAPVIMAGNHMPDYTNTGNNIGRRMVSIRFDNVVENTQDDLQERILKQELPNIVCRSLAAYKIYIDRVKANGGFWKAVPPIVLEWRSGLAASTNKLEEFLTADDDTRGCIIERVEGRFTSLSDFKAVYERKIGGKVGVKYVEDAAVFHAHGFSVSQKMEFVCKSCKQLSTGRPKCCTEYSDSNRWKKTLIHNMVVTVTPLSSNFIVTPDSTSSTAERAFKCAVELFTGLAFDKVRCDGILSEAGNPLELDLYCSSPDVTVAIEYNGYQHYVFPNTYHKTREDFEKGQLHDRIKVSRCRELDLALIVIRGGCLDQEMICFREAWSALGLDSSNAKNICSASTM